VHLLSAPGRRCPLTKDSEKWNGAVFASKHFLKDFRGELCCSASPLIVAHNRRMARCIYCGNITQLFFCDTAICISGDAARSQPLPLRLSGGLVPYRTGDPLGGFGWRGILNP
jgi:hypothetical protein